MYVIRNAVTNDIERIAEIEQLCFPEEEAATLDSFIKRFATFPECFFVLEIEGVVVGHINGCIHNTPELPDELYADASLHSPEGKYQTVFGLAVAPEYQGRGYASLLTGHFIKVSKTKGHHGMVLTCKDYLINFYQRHGFTCQGQSDSSHGGAIWNDMSLIY